jgi:hypothetical protein
MGMTKAHEASHNIVMFYSQTGQSQAMMRKTVKRKVRSRYCHRQSATTLGRRKIRKWTVSQNHLLWPQAVYLAICAACQKSTWVFPPCHDGQAVHLLLMTPGLFVFCSWFFSSHQLGIWRFQLSTLSVSASLSLREAFPLLCPKSKSRVFASSELVVKNVDLHTIHK